MFILRLNKIRIADNGAVRSGAGIFGHDFATVQFLSFVTTGNTALPDLERFVQTNDAQEREKIMADAVQNIVASRKMTPIPRVTDHAEIKFGDTGLTVYESTVTPDSLNWILLAIKSEQEARDAAQTVHEVLHHKDFSQLTNGILTLVKGGAALANPALVAGTQIAKFVADVTAQAIMNKHDKKLGVVNTSMDRAQHYINGLRDVQDAPDSTGNMWYDYAIFAYERAIPVT